MSSTENSESKVSPQADSASTAPRPPRRKRYSGRNPRSFAEKYKEHNAELYPETIAKIVASGKTPAGSHRPILVSEILDVLAPQPGETGVDCTLGHGGHTRELMTRVAPDGMVIGVDADPIELDRTEERLRKDLPEGVTLKCHHSNYAGLSKVLAELEVEGVDWVLADLGVSSMQLDDPSRGFSYKQAGPLDLRLNPQRGQTAAQLLARITVEKLTRILEENSDEPRADILAGAIVEARQRQPITTTTQLAQVIQKALHSLPQQPGDTEVQSTLARVFQALRIAVNDEFSALETLLRILPSCVNADGRVAILTFHSGEDRRVKHAFEAGWKTGLWRSIASDVIRPSAEERHANPRSSPAKLRWAIRSENPTGWPQPPTDAATSSQFTEDMFNNEWLEFRSSGIHGTGAFARKHIPSGTRVIQYIGERITKDESHKRCMANNQYIFTLDDESDLDGAVSWNPARFLNHSCDPNGEAIHDEGAIWIDACKDVAPGEEMTFNYGFTLESYKDYPCACGTAKCVGYIVAEEYFDQVRAIANQPDTEAEEVDEE